MREAFVIFRKDVKHLWPLGGAVSAIVAFHGWIDLRYEYSYFKTINTPLYDKEPWVLFLAWWCLVGVLVQQERTVGDRQYWLTRPISRKSVICAKALFLVAFVCVPSFLAQTVVLAVTGFSPTDYLGALVWNQLMIFSYFVMAAAFAAITRNFREYAGTCLIFFATFLFLDIWTINLEGGQWGGFEWVRETVAQIAILAAAVVVVAIQYAARRIAMARAVASTAGAVCLLLVSNAGWHTAFALTSAVAGGPDEASREVRVAFDPSASPAVAQATTTGARISIPVSVTGIPHGRELLSERVSVVVEASGAAIWNSGWRDRNELASRTIWQNSDDWLARDSQYWLSFDVPAKYLETVKNKPARLLVAIALSEFTSPVITRLPPHPRQHPVPEVGHCSLDGVAKFLTMVSCVAPFERRDAVDFHILPHSGAKAWEMSGCCISTYGPVRPGGSFSVWSDVGSMPSGPQQLSPDDEVSVEVRRPVSFFEREITIADIQLARYEVAR